MTIFRFLLIQKSTTNSTQAARRILTIVAIFLLGLSACKSQPTYQGYSGPAKSAAEEARVFIPREFNLVNVDGDSYIQPLVGNGTLIKLLPGEHKIVIKYVDFWSINADTDEKVASQPMLLVFNANAGEKYRIKSQELKDVTAAKAFAKNPQVDIISESSKTSVATDVKYQLEDKGLIAAFVDSMSSNDAPKPEAAAATAGTVAAAASATDSTSEPRSKGEPALEMLKYWWQKADAQQQEEFMKWIVE